MITTKQAMQIERAKRLAKKGTLPANQWPRLADAVRKMNTGREFVRVRKLSLRAGEELWDYVTSLVTAVQTNRVAMADGSLDIWVEGIYEDHVIVQDGNTGRLFKVMFSRNMDGEFSFGEPVEVRTEFVEVGNAGEVQKCAGDTVVEITKRVRSVFSGLI